MATPDEPAAAPDLEKASTATASSAPLRTLLEHLEDEEDAAVYALLMPDSYSTKQGSQLWAGVKLGKLLGAGAQAKVFQLWRDDETPIGKVIKINHGDLGSKILNNNVVWVGMDREWEVGTQLRAALQEPNGEVPGFMKVCDCLVTKRGNQAAFSGMLMGELHGFEVYKRIDTPEFHNIHYVREMLYQVFSALDRAQRKVGFLHADLGMRNIMENYSKTWDHLPPEQGEAAKAEARKRPGFTCNADGSRLPLGPDIEFKIIDFGVAKFSAKLAAAAAGSEAEEFVEKLHARQHERMRFGSSHSATALEFEPSDVTGDESSTSRLRSLFAQRRNPLRVIVRPVVKPVAAGAKALHTAVTRAPGRAGSTVSAKAAGGDGEAALKAEWDPIRIDTEPAEGKGTAGGKRRRRRRKRKSPIETMYRHFWHRKGDVFHLLLNIALVLDDRCWPDEDEDEVAALCSLIHHVTGVKLRVRTAEGVPGNPALFGRHKWQHWFRRWAIRLKGHVLPYNSGLLAREALSHPFFETPVVRHATLPVSLNKVFPED